MKRLIAAAAMLSAALAGARIANAQAQPLPAREVKPIYERLLKKIDRIPIYDNHSHATFPDDSNMDAQAAPQDASAVGIGDYFSLRNGNPLNLENVLRDPRYKNVNFVLIHGGYPYTLDMIWLTTAKNVYTDSSLMGYYVYPSELKNILKQWITLYPEKIMFGSDAFPFNEAVGAEETFWLAAVSARTAVAAALAELVAENAFSEDRAFELARMYLHDNAAKLYGGKPWTPPAN
jgi:predicted TIM-barrel fold metal-dependent hydrolase